MGLFDASRLDPFDVVKEMASSAPGEPWYGRAIETDPDLYSPHDELVRVCGALGIPYWLAAWTKDEIARRRGCTSWEACERLIFTLKRRYIEEPEFKLLRLPNGVRVDTPLMDPTESDVSGFGTNYRAWEQHIIRRVTGIGGDGGVD